MSFDDDTPTILPGSVAPISEQDASTRLSTPVPTSFTSSVTTDGVNSPPPSLAPGETGPLGANGDALLVAEAEQGAESPRIHCARC